MTETKKRLAVDNVKNNSNIFIVIGDAANGTTYNNLMFSLSVRES